MTNVVSKRLGVCGGSACIAGTRIPVRTLVACRGGGWDDAKILAMYPSLTAEQLTAAWEYDRNHHDEIANEITERHRERERGS